MVSHIMRENGKRKSWNNLKNEFKLEQRLYFRWIQLIHAILNIKIITRRTSLS